MSSVEDVEPLEHDRLHPEVHRELERETAVAHGGEDVYEMVDAIAAAESFDVPFVVWHIRILYWRDYQDFPESALPA